MTSRRHHALRRTTGPRHAALTLLEILLVLGVLATLTAIGVPAALDWRARVASEAAARVFTTQIELAKAEARRHGRTVQISLRSGDAHLTRDGVTIPLPHGATSRRILDDGTVIASTHLVFHPPHGTLDAVRRRTFEFHVGNRPNATSTVTVLGVTGAVALR